MTDHEFIGWVLRATDSEEIEWSKALYGEFYIGNRNNSDGKKMRVIYYPYCEPNKNGQIFGELFSYSPPNIYDKDEDRGKVWVTRREIVNNSKLRNLQKKLDKIFEDVIW